MRRTISRQKLKLVLLVHAAMEIPRFRRGVKQNVKQTSRRTLFATTLSRDSLEEEGGRDNGRLSSILESKKKKIFPKNFIRFNGSRN